MTMSSIKNKHQRFVNDCQYLGLKMLASNYREFIDNAGSEPKGYFDFLSEIVHLEAGGKNKRRIDYLVKNSRLPQPTKLIGDFDFDFQPTLNPKFIMELATMDFIEKGDSILFVGTVGTGKSHLAQSLGAIACQQGYRVYYTTCSEIISDLNMGVYEKTLDQRIKKYIKPQLLVIDEMGHDRLELQIVKEAHLLFKVIDQRYKESKPLIFTSNIDEDQWPEFLGDPVSTDAILDRIFHHSVIVRINGPSYRKYQGEKLQEKYRELKQNKQVDTESG
jgi:DNA replication protein DnaC